MPDAATYEATEILKNGLSVRIRAIRDDDKARLSAAFRKLDAESVYTRFFHHKEELTDQELEAATEVDFDTEVALVGTIEEAGVETIIAGARFMAFDAADGRRSAEVAFTVEEDHQGQGLASRLLQHLVFIARKKGVERFVADVLPQNKAMLTVFSRSGLPMSDRPESGSRHITLTLT